MRRPVKPVPTPKSIRPGARALRLASALAATGASRLDGISTPVPSRMRSVFMAAAVIDTNSSALMSCESMNQAWSKPSSSARRDDFPRVGCGRDADAEFHRSLCKVSAERYCVTAALAIGAEIPAMSASQASPEAGPRPAAPVRPDNEKAATP